MSHSYILAQRHAPLLQYGGGSTFVGIPYQQGYGDRFKGYEYQRGFGRCCTAIQTRNFQRGKGLNFAWLGKLLARAAPALSKGISGVKSVVPQVVSGLTNAGKELASALGSTAMSTGMQFMDDVISGENVWESAKVRAKQGTREAVDTAKAQALEQGLNLAKDLKRKMVDKFQDRQKQQSGRGLNKRRKMGCRGQRGGGGGGGARGHRGRRHRGGGGGKRTAVSRRLECRRGGRGHRSRLGKSVLPFKTVFDKW
jgi:hypothetical protein